ncbi:MAG: hypothetical protein HZA31_10815 [Opitutae bacterium]|nr:hypothetical protein [Opitutae bacterium]
MSATPLLSTPTDAPRQRPRRFVSHGGFTLVEAAVAAAVMVLVLTSSLAVLQRGFQSLDNARNITLVSQIMQSEMERLRLQSWDTVNNYGANDTLNLDSSFANSTAVSQRRISLTREKTSVHTDMLQIKFTVTWNSYDGRPYSRSYLTYYGRNGLYDYFYNSF